MKPFLHLAASLADYVTAETCGWDKQDIVCLTDMPGTENSGFWPSRANIASYLGSLLTSGRLKFVLTKDSPLERFL